MTDLRYFTADVFTAQKFGGNPLAVFPDCLPLDDALMLSLARELNLSETVFVFPPRDKKHDRHVRIFTPGRELPFAGHPTVGCAIVLAAQGFFGNLGARTDIVFEEGAGPVPVRIERRKNGFFAALTSPKIPRRLGDGPPRGGVAEMLSLGADDLATEAMSGMYAVAMGFLFAPVKSRDALARAKLDFGVWSRVMVGSPVQEVYVLTMDDWKKGREIWSRMFAPDLGIAEDPATGSAAATAARFLADLQAPPDGPSVWTIRQGIEMGRPSLIELTLTLKGGELAAVEVGGEAIILSEGRFFGL